MPAITRVSAEIATAELLEAYEPLHVLREASNTVAMGPMQVQVASGATAQELRIFGTQGITALKTFVITSDKSITVSYNGTAPISLAAGGFQALSGTSLTTVTITNATLDTANLSLWLAGTGDPPPPNTPGTFIVTGNDAALTADIEVTCSAVSSGLLACWDFDEATGTRVDHIGIYDLSMTGTVPGVAGKVRKAAQFNGSSLNYLQGPTTFPPLGHSAFTIAFWVNLTSVTAATQMIISEGTTTAFGNYHWLIFATANSGQVEAIFDSSGAGIIVSSAPLVLGSWTFVVIWHDGAALRLQINNGTIDEVAATFSATVLGLRPLDFGATGAGNDPLNGMVDSTQIYNVVLTPAQRATLWNGGAGI